ncbi:MAG: hypothetical protein CMM59_03910 [Rhodospirillaceae bacterium]|nr:hypothetical protein [Rhodospirillaceae bacterium]
MHSIVVRFNGKKRSPVFYGRSLRMLMARPKDVRLITIYGYSRLMRYDENFSIVPNILECLEVENGRFLTLHIRQRHRVSDGQPFTSEEFRYYWEDLANNTELSPVGPPKVFRVGNELPNFEIVDNTTVRFTWSQANRYFLQSLAHSLPIYIYRLSHNLRQFHTRYNDKAALKAEAQENGMQS